LSGGGLGPAAETQVVSQQADIRLVHPRDADATLAGLLAREQLDSAHTSPWRTWKAFKAFILLPVDCDDDVASFQCYASSTLDGNMRLRCLFVRQFSEAAGDEWEPFGAVALELEGSIRGRRALENQEIWSFDFPDVRTFEERVESLAEFQALCNAEVTEPDVFYQDA